MAETGSFKIPKLMQSKTTPTRSDEEILKELEELAKQHAKAGTLQGEGFAELLDEYVSSVSPDRENILKSKVSEILEKVRKETAGAEDVEGKERDEMIDYLIELLDVKKGANKEKIIDDIINEKIEALRNCMTPDGNNITATYEDGSYRDKEKNGMVESANFYDENGELIMNYWGNDDRLGLHQSYTKAEGERLQELISTYNAAYRT
jgi:hypothetical protein